MVLDGDVHELGQEFDECICLLATCRLKAEQNMKEADRFFALYKDELISLKKRNIDKTDWFPSLQRPNNGISDGVFQYRQAGPYYGRSSRF